MSSGELLVEREGAIGWLVINRPRALNALNQAVWQGIATAVAELAADAEIRVIALRGAGERAFVSGADIREFEAQRAGADGARAYDEMSEVAWRALERVDKPVIAMINGLCYGGGVSIAACCDLRLAGAGARFAIPALRLGLAYPLVAVERLVRIVGAAAAADLLLTGRVVDAAEARDLGLVHRVVADADLATCVRETAAQMAAGAPLTLAAHKRAIREVIEAPAQRDRAGLDQAIRDCFESEDYREGIRAFLAKRAPRFRGR